VQDNLLVDLTLYAKKYDWGVDPQPLVVSLCNDLAYLLVDWFLCARTPLPWT
jgi:hypothetical protein